MVEDIDTGVSGIESRTPAIQKTRGEKTPSG
jgi:hypothetical protein